MENLKYLWPVLTELGCVRAFCFAKVFYAAPLLPIQPSFRVDLHILTLQVISHLLNFALCPFIDESSASHTLPFILPLVNNCFLNFALVKEDSPIKSTRQIWKYKYPPKRHEERSGEDWRFAHDVSKVNLENANVCRGSKKGEAAKDEDSPTN